MSAFDPGEITQLLRQARVGDDAAKADLAARVYPELRRIAASLMSKERSHHTLQTTALINEAYLQLTNVTDLDWHDRIHFFAVAARIMRHILVDHARSKAAAKRGAGCKMIDIDHCFVAVTNRMDEILIVDELLNRLSHYDARQCQIAEMKFFAGLTEEEIAEVLDVSVKTVKRDWSMAKAWFNGQLSRTLGNDC